MTREEKIEMLTEKYHGLSHAENIKLMIFIGYIAHIDQLMQEAFENHIFNCSDEKLDELMNKITKMENE